MNICLISREYPPETGWGGIGTYTYHLAHGLANLGHRVHIIAQSLDVDKEYLDGKVYVHRIVHKTLFPCKGPFREFALRLEYSQMIYQKLKEIIKKYCIDIVETPNFSAEGFVYSLSKKAPLVTRLHTHFSEVIEFCQWPKTFDRNLSCRLEDSTILRSDLVTCSSQRHKDIVFDEIGLNSKNIEIIPLGIPLPDLIENSSKVDNPLTVLFVGRLEKRKGVHILIKSIPYVLKEIPNVTFILIGRDTFINPDYISFDGQEKYSFKTQLIKNIPDQFQQNVRFLGHVDNSELSKYFRSCNIFVGPSLYESFGFIYIEAMSYGKPVIGCKVGGIPEVMVDQKTGFLVPPGDPIALAKAIIFLLRNKQYREEMGRAARRHVEMNFTRELMCKNTLRAYRKVLNGKTS